ncbi:hypothetical protein D3C87_1870440 [compost metagenome]
MIADARIQADPFDDLTGVQSQAFRIAIQLVEVRHAHRQIGVSEQFDRLGFCRIGEEHINVFLNSPFLQ